MARLLADEHIMRGVLRRLGLLGHDVGTVRSDISESKAGESVSDAEVLAFAKVNHCAVVTKNVKDFKALHKKSGNHFGIVACTYDDQEDADKIGRAIHEGIKDMSNLRGEFIRVVVRD